MKPTNEIKRLQAMCGTYATAKHLKSLGYTLDQALHFLTSK